MWALGFEPDGTWPKVLVFFDEINAANCMALFKTIIIDRMCLGHVKMDRFDLGPRYGNKVIPENVAWPGWEPQRTKVRIISCCNPYRKRRNKDRATCGSWMRLKPSALEENRKRRDQLQSLATSFLVGPMRILMYSVFSVEIYSAAQELEDVALVFQAASGDAASGISDPMKELVYRVHPLPESLIDVVSDFGSLSEASEEPSRTYVEQKRI